jgi:ATP-dependent DNA helicase RecG
VAGLGLKSKTGAFKRTVKELLDQGLIAYTLPDKPDSRLQQYRLTELGQQVLDKRNHALNRNTTRNQDIG